MRTVDASHTILHTRKVRKAPITRLISAMVYVFLVALMYYGPTVYMGKAMVAPDLGFWGSVETTLWLSLYPVIVGWFFMILGFWIGWKNK